jgi:small subunit ribosomal protein S19
MSRSKWKGPYFNYKNFNTNSKKQKTIIHKNSEIVPQFIKQTFQIYNGKSYVNVSITDDMISHKFGEFIFTREKFSFKKKKK